MKKIIATSFILFAVTSLLAADAMDYVQRIIVNLNQIGVQLPDNKWHYYNNPLNTPDFQPQLNRVLSLLIYAKTNGLKVVLKNDRTNPNYSDGSMLFDNIYSEP